MTFTDEREKTLWAQAWMNFSGNPVDRAAACDHLITELRQRDKGVPGPIDPTPNPPQPQLQSLYVRTAPDFDNHFRMKLIDSFHSALGLDARESRRCFKSAAAGITLSATQEQINVFNSKVFEHGIQGLTVLIK